MATGVPIVPTGLVGTDQIQPPGTRLPRPFRPAVVRFGTPIDPTNYRGTRRECRRRITNEVMRAIGELTGQTRDGDVTGHDVTGHDRPHPQGDHDTDAITTLPARHPVGEMVDIDERVVVSPAAGVFTPLTPDGTHVEVGQRIGQVRTPTALIPCAHRSRSADGDERRGR